MPTKKNRTGQAVVLGAGTMGGGIAALLANAGWSARLLDVSEEAARAGLERVKSAKPPLLYLPEFAARIQIGNTTTNGACLHDADWIVEAVAEKMAVKQAVLSQIEANAKPDAVVSSSTSGLSLREMTQGRNAEFRRRFLGTHFLNPPRYLKLLEVIPLPETDPAVVSGFRDFAEQVLGQRVVLARDTPGFLSTRLGIRHLLDSIRLAIEHGLTVEETDFLTGELIGRPRSGTFRLADLIGLDILAAIASDQAARLPGERDGWRLPAIVSHLLAEGCAGAKSGAGFYKRGGAQTLTLDFNAGAYRPRQDAEMPEAASLLALPLPGRFAALRTHPAHKFATLPKREGEEGETGLVPALLDYSSSSGFGYSSRSGKRAQGEVGSSFLNVLLDALQTYVSQIAPEITDDPQDIDNVMRWGFGWAMGPLEIAACRAGTKWRRSLQTNPEWVSLAALKESGGTVMETPQGALVDLGDGAACLEFHTKMNTFSPALSAFITEAREQAEREFAALVIGNQGPHFSAGYDLNLFLQAMDDADWASIDRMLQEVQQAFLGLKYAQIPVVAAPHGYTLGAGCECALHCAAIHAAPELGMGLPETSVGVIPAGGGTKEMLARAMRDWNHVEDAFPFVESVFECLRSPQTSSSAEEAHRNGFLRPAYSVARNADRQLFEAKRLALGLAQSGCTPPARQGVWILGEEALARLRMKIHNEYRAGAVSEHDRLIADRLAWLLSGGVTHPQEVSEDYLMRLEREVFMELARHPKSQERMRHVLATGKPLRN